MSEQIREETMALLHAQEQLRQAKETFDRRMRQDARWFNVRMAMAWLAFALFPAVLIVCAWIVFHHRDFDSNTVAFAAGGLFTDSIGLIVSIWRVVLGKGLPPLPGESH